MRFFAGFAGIVGTTSFTFKTRQNRAAENRSVIGDKPGELWFRIFRDSKKCLP